VITQIAILFNAEWNDFRHGYPTGGHDGLSFDVTLAVFVGQKYYVGDSFPQVAHGNKWLLGGDILLLFMLQAVTNR
jgi:hypothetical protein